MEQGDKLNIKFPHFSVNGKGNVAINNSLQPIPAALLSKNFPNSTPVKIVFRIITAQYQLPTAQSQYRCGILKERKLIVIFLVCDYLHILRNKILAYFRDYGKQLPC